MKVGILSRVNHPRLHGARPEYVSSVDRTIILMKARREAAKSHAVRVGKIVARSPKPQRPLFGKPALERMREHYKSLVPDKPRLGKTKPANGRVRP